MRLAGIEGYCISQTEDLNKKLDEIMSDEEIGILLITKKCYNLNRERLDAIKLSAERPLVNVIPSAKGEAYAEDSIMRLMNEAIGVSF